MLADEECARHRGHQWRRSTGDRIDQAEIAGAVAFDQRGKIEKVDQG